MNEEEHLAQLSEQHTILAQRLPSNVTVTSLLLSNKISNMLLRNVKRGFSVELQLLSFSTSVGVAWFIEYFTVRSTV